MERPDLTHIEPAVREYIEFLERQVRLRAAPRREAADTAEPPISEAPLPPELPTRIQVITLSKDGYAKRTARHLYPRQHRSGMGIFDLDLAGDDYPAVLTNAEEDASLLLFTNLARAFRQPVTKIPSTAVHAKGELLLDRTPLADGEYVAAALPIRASGYVALLSAWGRVRILRHHFFGEHMRPGTVLFRTEDFGPLVSACWTPGDSDLFIASRAGQAIRFSEKLISPQGDLGIRLAAGDEGAAITAVYPDSAVFLIGRNGKGTLRAMNGFAPNKSAGGGGKQAMKTDDLLGAITSDRNDEIFLISRLGKIIRFRVDEVAESEGPVQGVICMSLRGDEVVAMLKSSPEIHPSGLS